MEVSGWMDEQFFKSILNEKAKPYWDFDEHGQRTKLERTWEKAQTEYDRIRWANQS